MYKNLLFIAFVFFLPLPSWGQTATPKPLNELLILLKKNNVDTNQFFLLERIGNYYLTKRPKRDLDSANYFYNKALQLSALLRPDPIGFKNIALLRIGELMITKDNVDEGKLYFLKVIDYYKSKNNSIKVAETMVHLSSAIYEGSRMYTYSKDIETYYSQALEIYKKEHNSLKQLEIGCNLIDLHSAEFKYDQAERECLQLIKTYKSKFPTKISDTYDLLASINRYKGNFNKSLLYSLESIKLMNLSKDMRKASRYYGELGLIYQELGQADKSIEWYRKTIALREKAHAFQLGIYRTAGFIVQQLILQGKSKEALSEILSLEKRNQPDGILERAVLAQIKAYCYEGLKQYKKAEQYYLTMMKIHPLEDDELYSYARYDIGKFYVKQKAYEKAEVYLKGLDEKNYLISQKKDLYFLEFKIDSAAGRYLNAIKNLSRYEALKDSIFNKAKSKQIEELQIQYETSKNAQEMKLLKKDSLLKQNMIYEANYIRNLTFLAVVILFLFLALLFYSFKIKQRNNIEINKKNLWLNHLVDEKEWLIKEVHHRVKNNLQIVMSLLQRQSTYIDNEKALVAIRNSEHRMHSIALIHQKLYQSETMALISMPEYIDELISYLKDCFDTGSRIQFYKEIENFNLDVAHAVPLGLILNEAITNAIKYAFPATQNGNIHISMRTLDDEHILLNIVDTGVGLPAAFNVENVNSLGMNLMKGLSKQLGGKFLIENINGVTISIIFKNNSFMNGIKNQNEKSYV